MENKTHRVGRIAAIEGLRGIAMTLIFFGHYSVLFRPYLPVGGASWRVNDYLGVIAHQGVCFFLILSGYFVYRCYLENPESYATFAFRRLGRIYPPYFAMCVLYVLLSALFPSESKIPPGSGAIPYLASNLLMVSSRPLINVSWTIGTLLALYTIVPLFWTMVRYERWKPVHRVGFMLLAAAIWFAVPKSLPILDNRVAFVLVGFALYEAMMAGARFERRGELPAIALLACGYVLWYATDRGWIGDLGIHLPVALDHYIFLAPGLFYACGYVVRGQSRLASCLEGAGLPRLGRISYSYYLCHGLILKGFQLVVQTLKPEVSGLMVFWAGLPIAYGCTLIGGWGWFHFVEARLAALVNALRKPAGVGSPALAPDGPGSPNPSTAAA